MSAGRNDACPCGSGKKHKKCCLEKPLALGAAAQPMQSEAEAQREERIAKFTNTGNQLAAQGRYADALELHAQALALDPNAGLVIFNRGLVYYSLGQLQAMQADFERAIALLPRHAEMLYKIGIPYIHLEQYERAINVLSQAVELDSSLAEAWMWLSRAHHMLGDYEKAYRLLAQGLEHSPGSVELQVAHALYLPRVPASHAAIDADRARFKEGINRLMQQQLRMTEPEKQLHFMPSALAYHGRNDKDIMQLFGAFMVSACPSLASTAAHCLPGKARRPGPIRIGFMLESVHNKTTVQFISGLMQGLKENGEFEVFLITNAPYIKVDQNLVAQMSHHCIRFGQNLAEARQIIAAAELDIIAYMEVGNYHMAYLLAHARLAPIQCVWGGFPVTTGIPNMDYYLTAQDAEPAHHRQHYSETPLLFSRIIAVFEKLTLVGETKPKRAYGLPERPALTYICPALLHKLHPDMDDIFAEILARDADAHVILFSSPQPSFQASMEARLKRAIAPEHYSRLVFLPILPPEDFLHVLTLADALLDPLHFSFGTTAFIAFSVDVPFITHRGEFMRGLTATYMYERMGMPDMIAESREAYIELVLHMAHNPAHRQAKSALIRERSAMFFNDVDVAPEIAARFKELHHRLQAHAA